MYPTDGGFESDMYSNIPNASLAFTMYSTTFGNGSFIIQPPMANEVNDGFPSIPYLSLESVIFNQQDGFPSIPYLSLESVIFNQQSSNPQSSPVNTIGGSNTGQQVISSTQTANDSTGTPRSIVGNQQTP